MMAPHLAPQLQLSAEVAGGARQRLASAFQVLDHIAKVFRACRGGTNDENLRAADGPGYSGEPPFQVRRLRRSLGFPARQVLYAGSDVLVVVPVGIIGRQVLTIWCP
jgi:hypothetical protein